MEGARGGEEARERGVARMRTRCGQPSTPTVLNHFGIGLGVGSVLPGRSALALGMPDPDHVFANGVAVRATRAAA